MRTIHTSLYGAKAFRILSRAFNYLDNSGTRAERRNVHVGKLEIAPDNELVLNINTDTSGYHASVFYKWQQDQDIRNWMANMLKRVATARYQYVSFPDNEWKRTSTYVLKILAGVNAKNEDEAVTVTEVYALYDLLKNRKGTDGRYPATLLEQFRGEQLDPIAAEMEKTRRDEEKRIKDKYDLLIQDFNLSSWRSKINDELNKKINALRDQYREISKREIAKLESERDAELAELNESLSLLTAMNA